MKEVFRNSDSALVGLYQTVLEDAGIPTILQNTETQQLPVAGLATALFPLPIFFPTLSVLDDEDYPRAMEILLSIKNAQQDGQSEWQCSKCGESVPGNFTACWNCQTERELPTVP